VVTFVAAVCVVMSNPPDAWRYHAAEHQALSEAIGADEFGCTAVRAGSMAVALSCISALPLGDRASVLASVAAIAVVILSDRYPRSRMARLSLAPGRALHRMTLRSDNEAHLGVARRAVQACLDVTGQMAECPTLLP
jgi:hypothetical protein